jgi:hypothetical protein
MWKSSMLWEERNQYTVITIITFTMTIITQPNPAIQISKDGSDQTLQEMESRWAQAVFLLEVIQGKQGQGIPLL